MRNKWLFPILIFLVACSSSTTTPTTDVAPTQTRAAELPYLTQIASRVAVVGSATPVPSQRFIPTPTTAPRLTVTATLPSAAAPQITTIDLPANDLVYDPHSKRLYASVSGKVGPKGNSIVAIDPATGSVGNAIFVGSEPGRMALSDDGQYIYVGLNGAGAVRRYLVREQKADIQFSLGVGQNFGTYLPADLAVAPGKPDTVIVARRYRNVSPGDGGAAAYVNGVKLPNEIGERDARTPLIFCGSDTTIYTQAEKILNLGDTGLTLGTRAPRVGEVGGVADFACLNGRLYTPNGQVIEIGSNTLLGTYTNIERSALVQPDDTVGRTFFMDVRYSKFPRFYIFDQATFTLIAQIDLPSLVKADSVLTQGRLVRWGDDGLAFTFGEKIVLLRSPYVSGKAIANTPINPIPQSRPTPTAIPTRTPTASQIRNATLTKLKLPINDVVYDPQRQKFYASISGKVPGSGNSIATIDPVSGQVESTAFVGSEPNRVALADDGSVLYVGLDGANAIARFQIAAQRVDQQIILSMCW